MIDIIAVVSLVLAAYVIGRVSGKTQAADEYYAMGYHDGHCHAVNSEEYRQLYNNGNPTKSEEKHE